jgi:hypothetical protein
LIHPANVSPKNPKGAWWTEHPVREIADLMGEDWQYYAPGGERLSVPRARSEQQT